MKIFKLKLALILGIIITAPAIGQYSLSGPSSALQGETHTYTVNGSNISNITWYTNNGATTSNQTSYGIKYKFNNTGTTQVKCKVADEFLNTFWLKRNVSVCGTLTAGSIAGNQSICHSGNPTTITSSALPSGGNGSYSYLWQYSNNGTSGWTNISGANSATYDPPGGLTSNRWYRRSVNSCSQTKYTGSRKVTIYDQLSAGSISGAQTICYTDDPLILTNGSGASGGNGSYSYQWQWSSDGNGGWTNISGATSTSYDPPTGLVADRWYRRQAISCGETKYTGSVKLTVTAGPLFYADTDGDGYGDSGYSTNACSQPAGYVPNSSDHDDTTVMITNLAPQTFYSDVDGDGFGVASPTIYTSFRPLGYADNTLDQCPETPGATNGCDYLTPTLSDENYVYTRAFQSAMSSAANIKSNSDVLEDVAYFDGLGRTKQQVSVRASGTATRASSPNYPAEWTMDWTEGTGGTPFFNKNGTTGENERFYGPNPFGETALIWRCGNEPDHGSDGGWNTDYINVDKTKTYRYMVWVRRDQSQNGTTYHGTQNVDNLGGGANGNPYFWYGDLPQLGKWYLLVGIVHPYTHGSTDTGVSGVYDINGNQVIDKDEFKWRSDTTTARFRSYLYYSTDVNVRQYFYRPHTGGR